MWLTFTEGYNNLGYTPSERELEKEGISLEDWNNNSPILQEGGSTIPAKELVEACDHFEDQLSYLVAKKIAEALSENFI